MVLTAKCFCRRSTRRPGAPRPTASVSPPTSPAPKAAQPLVLACAASLSATTARRSWSWARSSSPPLRPRAESPMANPRHNLLPSVLDRLIDDDPEAAKDAPTSRARQLAALRNAVRRDLEALLNSHKRCLSPPSDLTELEPSVIEYGLPDFLSVFAGASTFREQFRRAVEETIRLYEPRFIKVTVTLRDDGGQLDRTLRFRIDALMQADPAPEPVSYDSHLDP